MEQAGTIIAIVSGVFGGVIALLIYIWNLTQKSNDRRHVENERLIGDLIKSKHINDLILQRLDILVTSHDEDIRKLTA